MLIAKTVRIQAIGTMCFNFFEVYIQPRDQSAQTLSVASSHFDSPRKISSLRGFTYRKEELDMGVIYIMRSSLMEQ